MKLTKKNSAKVILSASIALLPFISNAQTSDVNTVTLEQLQAIGNTSVALEPGVTEKDRDLRMQAIQQAAQTYGARAALAQRTNLIRSVLEKNSAQWDVIWNFNSLMLIDEQVNEKNPTMRPRLIIPAIIEESVNNTRQDSDLVFHIVGHSYNIRDQAKFSSFAPTWRTYLLRDPGNQTISPPHSSLLPKNDEEKRKFKQWIAEGWDSGISQAMAIYKANINRLVKDYDGMHLYHDLVDQKKLTLPFVATSNQAITGDDSTMNIDDITLKITVMPAFQHNSAKWKPVNQ